MSDPAATLRSLFDGHSARGLREESGPRWSLFRDRSLSDPDAFALSVARSLSDHPRWLDCRYLYDAEGSAIFTRITQEPEYYPTRAEAEIFHANAGELAQELGHLPIVELGAGTSEKTRQVLRAWCDAFPEAVHYVPIDIDPSVLRGSARSLTEEFQRVHVSAVAASYENGLEYAAELSPLTLLFMGSTIGNMNVTQLEEFLVRVEAALSPGDGFLLGADLVKDPSVLEAAYNDTAGHTQAFTRNLFARMNRELGCRVPLDAVQHVAYWNARLERIEIYARFSEEVDIEIPSLQRSFRMAPGEMVMTEISRKFRIDQLAGNVARFGFRLERTFTDSGDRFGVLLFRKGARRRGALPRRRLAADLQEVRLRTLALVEPLTDEQLLNVTFPERGPIAQDLAHLAAFEERWLLRRPESDEAPTVEPGPLDRTALFQRLEAVRHGTLEELERLRASDKDPLLKDGFAYRMVARHEEQQQERMLGAISQLDNRSYEPAHRADPPSPLATTGPEMVLVPGGGFLQGARHQRNATWDSDLPAFWVEVAAFRIDTAPVTNGQFLAFTERGGYEQRELWSDEGWDWRCRSGARRPAAWEHGERGWEERHFGRTGPLLLSRPMMHVSYYEAEAFARSVRKRLPTEGEWEKAAGWDPERGTPRHWPWGDSPPSPALANLDGSRFAPDPVGSHGAGRSFYGCHQMVGDVWEWTTSEFRPYAGFEPFPDRKASQEYFGKGYLVLRGGSWATSSRVASNTCRHRALPHVRDRFTGFRCVQDA